MDKEKVVFESFQSCSNWNNFVLIYCAPTAKANNIGS